MKQQSFSSGPLTIAKRKSSRPTEVVEESEIAETEEKEKGKNPKDPFPRIIGERKKASVS